VRKAMNLCLEQVRPCARRSRLRWNWPLCLEENTRHI